MPSLLLILALVLPPAPPVWRVLVLVPPGAAPAAAAPYAADLDAALAWWQARGFDVGRRGAAEVRTLTGDPLADLGPGVVAVIVTDTFLLDQYQGLAGAGQIWVTTAAPNLPAVMAHELGHAALWLPNGADDCRDVDIMCPVGLDAAYRAGVVGCATLARLGRPCVTVALPEVVR